MSKTRISAFCDLLLTAFARDSPGLKADRPEPQKIQPEDIGHNRVGRPKEEVVFGEIRGDLIVRLRSMSNAAEGKIPRDSHSSQRGPQSNGTAAKGLPANGQTAKNPRPYSAAAQNERADGKASQAPNPNRRPNAQSPTAIHALTGSPRRSPVRICTNGHPNNSIRLRYSQTARNGWVAFSSCVKLPSNCRRSR